MVGVAAERGDPQRAVRRISVGLAASAELRQMNVRDADLAERIFERLGVEVRMPCRAGLRTNIREGFDFGRTQGREEFLERPRAVTDGPDVHRHRRD